MPIGFARITGFALLFLGFALSVFAGLWPAIPPEKYAAKCALIVVGEMVEVRAEPKEVEHPRDAAVIQINDVLKDGLSDREYSVGDTVEGWMSGTNVAVETSQDIR